MSNLLITGPQGETYPYFDKAKAYLLSPGCPVSDFAGHHFDSAWPVEITWTCRAEDVTGFTVAYGRAADLSDATTVDMPAEATSVSLFNLYKNSMYYVRVTAHGARPQTAATTFRTAALGPRVMQIDGVCNVRDIGGYTTPLGTIRQGLLYRGSTLTPTADFPMVQVTARGIQTLQRLGIKTDLDLRGPQEARITASAIPGVKLEFCPINGYLEHLEQYTEGYRKVFTLLAEPESYPVYFHCTGGADRTGTIAFLVGALLGMPERQLVQDYEFTSFSHYSIRDTQGGTYQPYFDLFMTTLSACAGETLTEKTESLLGSIGITPAAIAAIREILIE